MKIRNLNHSVKLIKLAKKIILLTKPKEVLNHIKNSYNTKHNKPKIKQD